MEELIETTKMSTRGQVIIPKDIREYMGVKENTLFTVVPLDKETLLMKKIDKKRLLGEFRMLRAGVKNKLSEGEIMNEIKSSRKN